jgi:hypothetical protein
MKQLLRPLHVIVFIAIACIALCQTDRIPFWVQCAFVGTSYIIVLAIAMVWIDYPEWRLLRSICWPLFRNKALMDIEALSSKNYTVYCEIYNEISKGKKHFVSMGWEAFSAWKHDRIEDFWVKAKYLRAV